MEEATSQGQLTVQMDVDFLLMTPAGTVDAIEV
jgi:hypothetical protein